jgi:pimeloyl-ACP methyl ester carboxylesterase
VLSRSIRPLAVGLAAIALLAACAGSNGPRADGTLPGDDVFGWQPTGDDSIETGTLEVPRDWDDPDAGTFLLSVARRFADEPEQRIGTLVVNPGGPGFGGTSLVFAAEQIYSEELLARFDIVGWDPRGTGASTPAIDCIDDYDRFHNSTDITPDDDAERNEIVDLATEFADACAQRSPDLFEHVGTNDSARDIDAIRRALGEDTISYFGFSYGSELGAVWATLFPETVRAAVFDGAVDPQADDVESSLQQTAGFEEVLDTFLAECGNDTDCPFRNGGKATDAFDRLMLDLDDEPLPALDGRPPLTRGAALDGVAQALYSRDDWPVLAQALSDAQLGDGSGLMELYDRYYQRRADGSYDEVLEAFQVISCADTTERRSVEEEDALAPEFRAAAPRMSPGTTGGYFCTFFPPSSDPRVDITGATSVPIVVIGTTGDPATPLVGTQAMADALADGRLVIVEADEHTGYSASGCARDLVATYLLEPAVGAPPDGTRCSD